MRNSFKISIKIKKTGTTIVGVVFSNGVVLGSDTRATINEIAYDNNCDKIHYISPNICCCGAGTSADTENITRLVSNQLELDRLSEFRETSVVSVATILQNILFQNNGMISAALIVGGFDDSGSHIYSIHPYGSAERLSYMSLGSGSLAALSILENYYKDGLELKNAVQIVKEAVLAGIYSDMGSGGNIDICVLEKKKIKFKRNFYKNREVKFGGRF